MAQPLEDDTEALLARLGLERTRENYLAMHYADFPDDWDEEAEAILPPDLRIVPAPSVPFPDDA